MTTRESLNDWVLDPVRAYDGEETVLEVARRIWDRHEHQLRDPGDLFYIYTRQYDIP